MRSETAAGACTMCVNTHALAALARFDSETRRPPHDRDRDAMVAAVTALSPRVSSPRVERALEYLARHPTASANETALYVGGRRQDALWAAREARELLGTAGNRLRPHPGRECGCGPSGGGAKAQIHAGAT